MKLIKILTIFGLTSLLIFIHYHVLHTKGQTNHTGLNVLVLGWFFISMPIIVFFYDKLQRRIIWQKDKLVLIILGLILLIGISFLLFDYLNLFIQHGRWIKKGMPDKPFWY